MGDQTVDKAFQLIHQDMLDIKRKQAALAAQVERIQRTARLDEREAAIGQQQSNREVITAVTQLTRAVTALTDQQKSELDRSAEEGRRLRRVLLDKRQREMKDSLRNIRHLSTLIQQVTPRCPCGKHKGIAFVDSDGRVVHPNMCPQAWWVSRSRLAFEEGRLQEFNQKYPLDRFLSMYQL